MIFSFENAANIASFFKFFFSVQWQVIPFLNHFVLVFLNEQMQNDNLRATSIVHQGF